jgi:transcriptional regulator with XRE-family HTH domain
MLRMSTVLRRRARASQLAGDLRRSLGAELRNARLAAGLSLADVSRAAGLSKAEVSRVERSLASWVSVETVSLVAVVVGLRPSIRLYPDGSSLRDSAHEALLARLRRELPGTLEWRVEVPLPIPGDRRAWDATIRAHGWWIAVEAETRIHDLQALERRLALKRRDGGEPCMILLINDTRPNRAALATARESLRAEFPLEAREILGALRAGRAPTAGGVVRL